MLPRLLVIAKSPKPGRCKTRLCPPCTPEQAAALAEASLRDTLATVAATECSRRVLVLDGEAGDWLPGGFDVVPQAGGPLGARLEAAFARFEGPSLQFAFFNAIIGIAVLVGLLGIVNTLSMSVLERTREIGVLRALGGSRWRIRRAILDESLLISLAGSIAGIAAGLLVGAVWLFSIRASTLAGLEPRIPTGILLLIAVLGVAIGTLAAVLPARRAARLDPLRALTYE